MNFIFKSQSEFVEEFVVDEGLEDCGVFGADFRCLGD